MWNLWVMQESQPLAPGASCDCQLKAYLRAGNFMLKTGSKLKDLELEKVELFGESVLMITDPKRNWGIATLETT